MRPVNRVTPALPAASMKTYQVAAPLATHWRPATCAEVGCPNYLNGWLTRVPFGSELAEEARGLRGRYHFVETREEGDAVFTFPPGQACFRASAHQVPLERDPVFLVRGGDWRGNPRGTPARAHRRPEDWVDDFATHQQDLADRIERG